jgi:hypothetical protein
MQSIALRLAACGLTMHPEKSKIVYRKDTKCTRPYPYVNFTFLGFTFRPRKYLVRKKLLLLTLILSPGRSLPITGEPPNQVKDRKNRIRTLA